MAKKYIDADRLKQTIANNVYIVRDAFNSRDYGMFWTGGIEKAIDEQPVVNIEPRWIPVTERLPDINDHYTSDVCLVYCDNGAYAFAELEENIFGQVGWDCEREDDYHEAVGTVVAWMLLPTPYKSGEEE